MSELSPNLTTGLTSAQAAERVARGESNAYQSRVGRSYWEIVRDNLLNLFNLVLGVLLVVVLLFHDYSTFFFAGFSVVSNTFLGMIQEIFAKRKLDALAALSLSDVRVYRDGQVGNDLDAPDRQGRCYPAGTGRQDRRRWAGAPQ